MPAEPAFPCGDDNNRQQTADSTSRFGLGIFPAGGGPAGRRRIGDFPGRRRGGPAGRRWIGDFPGRWRSGRVGVGLGIFRILGPSLPAPADPILPHICTAHFSIGFQLYRTFFYRIPVVRHKFIRVYSSCCRRQKGKPASCAGCDYCGREPALPAFSTDAPPRKMGLCCLVVIF